MKSTSHMPDITKVITPPENCNAIIYKGMPLDIQVKSYDDHNGRVMGAPTAFISNINWFQSPVFGAHKRIDVPEYHSIASPPTNIVNLEPVLSGVTSHRVAVTFKLTFINLHTSFVIAVKRVESEYVQCGGGTFRCVYRSNLLGDTSEHSADVTISAASPSQFVTISMPTDVFKGYIRSNGQAQIEAFIEFAVAGTHVTKLRVPVGGATVITPKQMHITALNSRYAYALDQHNINCVFDVLVGGIPIIRNCASDYGNRDQQIPIIFSANVPTDKNAFTIEYNHSVNYGLGSQSNADGSLMIVSNVSTADNSPKHFRLQEMATYNPWPANTYAFALSFDYYWDFNAWIEIA